MVRWTVTENDGRYGIADNAGPYSFEILMHQRRERTPKSYSPLEKRAFAETIASALNTMETSNG
jgi:hypothetical protein